jgi:hypothetical protein
MKGINLITINEDVKKLLLNHMEKHKVTLNQIAYRCKIHQSQLWMYVYSNDKKGIHSKSLERIGEYLNQYGE